MFMHAMWPAPCCPRGRTYRNGCVYITVCMRAHVYATCRVLLRPHRMCPMCAWARVGVQFSKLAPAPKPQPCLAMRHASCKVGTPNSLWGAKHTPPCEVPSAPLHSSAAMLGHCRSGPRTRQAYGVGVCGELLQCHRWDPPTVHGIGVRHLMHPGYTCQTQTPPPKEPKKFRSRPKRSYSYCQKGENRRPRGISYLYVSGPVNTG